MLSILLYADRAPLIVIIVNFPPRPGSTIAFERDEPRSDAGGSALRRLRRRSQGMYLRRCRPVPVYKFSAHFSANRRLLQISRTG